MQQVGQYLVECQNAWTPFVVLYIPNALVLVDWSVQVSVAVRVCDCGDCQCFVQEELLSTVCT